MRTVHCSKLDRDLPGLEKPPFPGELGDEIFRSVSADAWRMWNQEMMIKIINEYRLNLADEKDYAKLLEQMRAFLNLGGAGKALEVENATRGRGEK